MAIERASRRQVSSEPEAALPGAQPRRRPFTVDEYYRMADAGILGEDDRVELIEGEIVEMPPIGPEHAGGVIGLTRLFVVRCANRAEISIQNPIRLGVKTEPQPDVALVRPAAERGTLYRQSHPGPADVYLLVEVADSSLAFDLGEKAALYARYGIPELWVIDLRADRVVVHREPSPDGFRAVTEHIRGQSVAPAAFPDLPFAIDELLG